MQMYLCPHCGRYTILSTCPPLWDCPFCDEDAFILLDPDQLLDEIYEESDQTPERGY